MMLSNYWISSNNSKKFGNICIFKAANNIFKIKPYLYTCISLFSVYQIKRAVYHSTYFYEVFKKKKHNFFLLFCVHYLVEQCIITVHIFYWVGEICIFERSQILSLIYYNSSSFKFKKAFYFCISCFMLKHSSEDQIFWFMFSAGVVLLSTCFWPQSLEVANLLLDQLYFGLCYLDGVQEYNERETEADFKLTNYNKFLLLF